MQQGPQAPESQPTKQGRRLIRMLFRSAADEFKSTNSDCDSRVEVVATWKNTTIQPETIDKQVAPTSKFASLKRKLFPSQNRRYPRLVPPLISPSSAPLKTLLPPIENNDNSLSRKSTGRTHDNGNDSELAQDSECLSEIIRKQSLDEPQRPEDDSDSACHPSEGDNNWGPGRRTLMDDDDDLDLENAVEALDFENSVEDNTLEEMSKAIDDLRAWKQIQEHETQEALIKLQAEQELLLQTVPLHYLTHCDESLEVQLELKHQNQQRVREAQTLELQREAEAYQLEVCPATRMYIHGSKPFFTSYSVAQQCNLFRTKLDESEVSRVEEALQNSDTTDSLALSRLRNELFQLNVKQRQDALLQEIQGAHNELDMTIMDVQTFTGELDAILAQFDHQS